ncbi:MAG: YraN family protein [Flavobacteriales bacterium]|nr:YraN family protein [Flavobacteriales bacterium]MCC6939222.1 YraN family protein [Flavobacteriales bacterium]
MAEHNLIGAQGEQLACRYLEEHGFEIVERNWRYGRHEIDIIAKQGAELVFVEVKTRSTDQHGEPEEAVKKGKRGRVIKAANAYVQATGADLRVRFDIVSIILHPSGKPYIHHIPDAFYPTTHDRPF